MGYGTMEPFKIFVSHRAEDTDTAHQIASKLREWGRDNLQLSLSDGPMTGWGERTRKIVLESDLLLLLLTPESILSGSLDLTLFEVGLFQARKDTSGRLVVLSVPNLAVPAPLLEYQVLTDRKEVARFLRELFGGTALTGRSAPINSRFGGDSDKVLELASQICALLPPVPHARMHANSLILKFNEDLHEPVIPEKVKVEANAMSLQMFGLLERDLFTWGDIRRSLHGETAWISELGEAIYAIANGRLPKPINSTFASAEGVSFIPVVYRDETLSSGWKLFHVLFVPTDVVPVDPELVFVIAAFTNDMDPIYEAIKATSNSCGLSAKRVKDIVGDYRITDKILKLISQAKYVVADLTHERPNVYFELGYARGLGKTVITTVRKGTTVHFDVKDWTYIEYDDSRTLERQLVERLK